METTKSGAEVVVFEGSRISGKVVDGGGAWFNGGRLTEVRVQSTRVNGRWSVPRNFTFTNWKLNGSIRVVGMGASQSTELLKSSRSLGHTGRVQAAAPRNITLSNLTIKASSRSRMPLVVAPGATGVTLRDSTITGKSVSAAIYLDAESAGNVIRGNTFALTPSREVIAVDGSRDNLIEGNRFLRLPWGGINVYRNCGEGGVIRHQEPTGNRIRDNFFDLDTLTDYWSRQPMNRKIGYRYAVWLGSREDDQPGYCSEDKGWNFGSSADNGDFADRNQVVNNTYSGRRTGYTSIVGPLKVGPYDKFVEDDGSDNTISGNRDRSSARLSQRFMLAPSQPGPLAPAAAPVADTGAAPVADTVHGPAAWEGSWLAA
ncbi:MAG: right-handed parallel beta-helix repeat-containing protein [Cyanobacteriota bacterium]